MTSRHHIFFPKIHQIVEIIIWAFHSFNSEKEKGRKREGGKEGGRKKERKEKKGARDSV